MWEWVLKILIQVHLIAARISTISYFKWLVFGPITSFLDYYATDRFYEKSRTQNQVGNSYLIAM